MVSTVQARQRSKASHAVLPLALPCTHLLLWSEGPPFPGDANFDPLMRTMGAECAVLMRPGGSPDPPDRTTCQH